jgi:beta-glucanase (GH16 family)
MNPCTHSLRRKRLFLAPIFLGMIGVAALPFFGSAETRQSNPNQGKWTLTWSDEFDGPNGSAPNPTKWMLETGGHGWGNQELEYYTTRRENTRIENGNLVIEARREKYTGPDRATRAFTSGRLKTQGLFSQKYGRFEARIKVPSGQGMWPAFWMLGDDVNRVGWPQCGEIDIMENVGNEPWTLVGSLHGPGYSGEGPLHGFYITSNRNVADDYHVFAIEWEPAEIRFYMDDYLYETRTPDDRPTGTRWVFDHPFFLILNLAVGGKWPGAPDETTRFPRQMLVDYVRVYARK